MGYISLRLTTLQQGYFLLNTLKKKRPFQRILTFCVTRSCAALRAADLDWIVGPEYSLGGYIFGDFQLLRRRSL